MRKLYFALENNRVIKVEGNFGDIVRMFGHGNVFTTNAEAESIRDERLKPKTRELSALERKQQYAWGLSMMTETEKEEVATEKKKQHRDIDYEQFLFAMQMEGIVGKEFKERKNAFFERRQERKRNPFYYERG